MRYTSAMPLYCPSWTIIEGIVYYSAEWAGASEDLTCLYSGLKCIGNDAVTPVENSSNAPSTHHIQRVEVFSTAKHNTYTRVDTQIHTVPPCPDAT